MEKNNWKYCAQNYKVTDVSIFYIGKSFDDFFFVLVFKHPLSLNYASTKII